MNVRTISWKASYPLNYFSRTLRCLSVPKVKTCRQQQKAELPHVDTREFHNAKVVQVVLEF